MGNSPGCTTKFDLKSLAAIAALGCPSPSDFPKFDSTHANCAMETDLNESCATVAANVHSEIEAWGKGGPAQGIYKFKEGMTGMYEWVTRTTPVHHYTDDIIFQYFPNEDGSCHVSSKSKSEPLSYYDYETNYCN